MSYKHDYDDEFDEELLSDGIGFIQDEEDDDEEDDDGLETIDEDDEDEFYDSDEDEDEFGEGIT